VRTRPRHSALATLAGIAATALVLTLIATQLRHAQREPGLPLRDASVIRAQAADKHLDSALIAAVIYAESKFEPSTSSAGALGLMQILPETANFIAGKSGGIRFTTSDLATPAINVAYGSWYLRYLLDHYNGHELPAIAAYNAGLANVDAWLAHAGGSLAIGDIPFPETQAYVQRVLQAQQEYRTTYPRQLGLG
jgi:soluble lytic murein transglycosylase